MTFLISIKFSRDKFSSQEALTMIIGVPIDEFIQNSQKISARELIFSKVLDYMPATLLKINHFRDLYFRL